METNFKILNESFYFCYGGIRFYTNLDSNQGIVVATQRARLCRFIILKIIVRNSGTAVLNCILTQIRYFLWLFNS